MLAAHSYDAESRHWIQIFKGSVITIIFFPEKTLAPGFFSERRLPPGILRGDSWIAPTPGLRGGFYLLPTCLLLLRQVPKLFPLLPTEKAAPPPTMMRL